MIANSAVLHENNQLAFMQKIGFFNKKPSFFITNHLRLSAYSITYSARFILYIFLVFLSACSSAQAAKKNTHDLPQISTTQVSTKAAYAPVWHELALKLAKDGLSGPRVDELLAMLGPEPTQSPMGRKIRELYQRSFFPKPKPQKPNEQYYKGVVTQANAQLCRQYIAEHEKAFMDAYQRYGVPPDIASALLFVETRLGKVLADVPENAFYTLASMAVSTAPEDISQWLPRLKGYQKHMSWLKDNMHKRANWAYNETRALMQHMIRDNISPSELPSSIYGAVGLCQFMPSNISVYGADGDADGRVDLFNVPDAVASLANYLKQHGWKPGLSWQQQHKVLMTYNHSAVYANTILALANLIAHPAAISGAVDAQPEKNR